MLFMLGTAVTTTGRGVLEQYYPIGKQKILSQKCGRKGTNNH